MLLLKNASRTLQNFANKQTVTTLIQIQKKLQNGGREDDEFCVDERT